MIFRRNDQKLSLAVCYTVFCKEETRTVEYRKQIKKAMEYMSISNNTWIRRYGQKMRPPLDDKFSNSLKADNMQNRPITGTSEWNLYSCVLDVPKEAKIINIGILLSGKGRVWMDNVSFQKVDKNIPTTDFEIQKVYPDHPENMSFEE